ncbi:ROK family transcriptional regulator [Rhabdaerophilum sp. SD176]|uniref:ROK family transcriptional regulator n=1 Tax=Rhabdaerophilum sp. SD176 TaxID=2983548 RepID=UPI0024DFA116|nr:ROK family transcriptional regulator [Rhabdaerophilum sp. SD176]
MNISSATRDNRSGRRDDARARLLEALRRNGSQSRATIGRMLGMSPSSISGLTSKLIEEGLLADIGTDTADLQSGPGRPGALIGFNPARGQIIGLWVGLDRIALHLADFAGNTLALADEAIAISRLEPAALVAALAERIEAFRQLHAPAGRVLAIAVAFQGFVDRGQGIVAWSPVTPHADLPLARSLEQATGLMVVIDNDASAMAHAILVAEKELRAGVTACVMIGDGVGLGVFIDGEPLGGRRGGGIEFGHIPLDPDGPQCRCGARGCVESYLADYALLRDAMAISAFADPIRRLYPGESEMQALASRADEGDRAILGLLQNAGRVLSQGVATLIHLFQPRAVVFCGPGMRAWPHLERGLLEGLKRYAIPGLSRDVTISARAFRAEMLTRGIVLSVLAEIDRTL